MLRLIVTLFIAASLLSCATNQPKKEPPPPADQAVVLPDVKLEPVASHKKEGKAEPKQPPVILEKGNDEKYVILNFDDADIETVISTMGDLLQINYILQPGVSGKVTIQSYKKFPVKELFSIFQTILEMNGLTAVKNKDFYIIMPIDAAKQQPLDLEKGKDVHMQLDSGFITQLIPLEYVKASDAANLLRGLMPRGTDLVVYEPTNLLIVTARPEALVKFMKILEAIDISPSDRENIKTFVYYVENGEAKKLAEILRDIYGQKDSAKRPSVVRSPARTPMPGVPMRAGTRPAEAQPATSTVISGGLPGEISGDISITAYDDINALIIKSSPSAYLSLLETIKKIDIAPKQVLIEVLIAEISLNNDAKLGLEWLLKSGGKPSTLSGHLETSGISINTDTLEPGVGTPPSGYFAYVIDPGKFISLINAFASYGKVNVVSSPHILALDNKEAKIEIGAEIPIATGVNTSAVGTTTSGAGYVSTGQIQYRTAGTIITVTPHISEKNKVTLKLNEEFSNVGAPVQVAGQDFPSFNTRKAQTTGIVQDGHTLVIGGLISENKSSSKGGFPILSNIPLLGYLFSTTTLHSDRTELIVMVTPHVVGSMEDADAITQNFQDKVRTIKERLKNYKSSVMPEQKDQEEGK